MNAAKGRGHSSWAMLKKVGVEVEACRAWRGSFMGVASKAEADAYHRVDVVTSIRFLRLLYVSPREKKAAMATAAATTTPRWTS